MNYSYKILNENFNIESFCCGGKKEHNKLNQFLKEHALIDQKDFISATTIIFDEKNLDNVIGYMTLLADKIKVEETKKKSFIKLHKIRHKYSFYPALKIGRIAVDQSYQNKKFGQYLFNLSVGFAAYSNQELGIGIRFIVVDSKDMAKDWYLNKLDFKVYDDDEPNFLYYDLKGWKDE